MSTPVYPLTAEQEKIWREMQELRQHPRYQEALGHLDPRFRQAYINLMDIPRRWLADGRELQVRAAISAIKRALLELS